MWYWTLWVFLPFVFTLDRGTGLSVPPTSPQEIRWSSMEPLFSDGEMIQIDPQVWVLSRGDIAVFEIEMGSRAIIKRVVGIPWDRFSYTGGVLSINGDILTTSECIPYHIESPLLALIAQSSAIIPPDSYLILGNIAPGTWDSSKFWLISGDQLVGKVITPTKTPLNTCGEKE